MRRSILLIAALVSLHPAVGAANTPVVHPDPAALAAARALVADLPIEDGVSFNPVANRVAASIYAAWERYDGAVPAGADPAAFRALFAARLRSEAGALVPAVLPEVEEALAVAYALRFRPPESEAARRFYAGEGRRFAFFHVFDSAEIASLIEQRVEQRLSPRLAELVAESARGVALLSRINRPPR